MKRHVIVAGMQVVCAFCLPGCSSEPTSSKGGAAAQLELPESERAIAEEPEGELSQREMNFVVMLDGKDLPVDGTTWHIGPDDELSDVKVHSVSEPDANGFRKAVVSFRAVRATSGIAAKVEMSFKEQIVPVKGGGEITTYPEIQVKVESAESIPGSAAPQ